MTNDAATSMQAVLSAVADAVATLLLASFDDAASGRVGGGSGGGGGGGGEASTALGASVEQIVTLARTLAQQYSGDSADLERAKMSQLCTQLVAALKERDYAALIRRVISILVLADAYDVAQINKCCELARSSLAVALAEDSVYALLKLLRELAFHFVSVRSLVLKRIELLADPHYKQSLAAANEALAALATSVATSIRDAAEAGTDKPTREVAKVNAALDAIILETRLSFEHMWDAIDFDAASAAGSANKASASTLLDSLLALHRKLTRHVHEIAEQRADKGFGALNELLNSVRSVAADETTLANQQKSSAPISQQREIEEAVRALGQMLEQYSDCVVALMSGDSTARQLPSDAMIEASRCVVMACLGGEGAMMRRAGNRLQAQLKKLAGLIDADADTREIAPDAREALQSGAALVELSGDKQGRNKIDDARVGGALREPLKDFLTARDKTALPVAIAHVRSDVLDPLLSTHEPAPSAVLERTLERMQVTTPSVEDLAYQIQEAKRMFHPDSAEGKHLVDEVKKARAAAEPGAAAPASWRDYVDRVHAENEARDIRDGTTLDDEMRRAIYARNLDRAIEIAKQIEDARDERLVPSYTNPKPTLAQLERLFLAPKTSDERLQRAATAIEEARTMRALDYWLGEAAAAAEAGGDTALAAKLRALRNNHTLDLEAKKSEAFHLMHTPEERLAASRGGIAEAPTMRALDRWLEEMAECVELSDPALAAELRALRDDATLSLEEKRRRALALTASTEERLVAAASGVEEATTMRQLNHWLGEMAACAEASGKPELAARLRALRDDASLTFDEKKRRAMEMREETLLAVFGSDEELARRIEELRKGELNEQTARAMASLLRARAALVPKSDDAKRRKFLDAAARLTDALKDLSRLNFGGSGLAAWDALLGAELAPPPPPPVEEHKEIGAAAQSIDDAVAHRAARIEEERHVYGHATSLADAMRDLGRAAATKDRRALILSARSVAEVVAKLIEACATLSNICTDKQLAGQLSNVSLAARNISVQLKVITAVKSADADDSYDAATESQLVQCAESLAACVMKMMGNAQVAALRAPKRK